MTPEALIRKEIDRRRLLEQWAHVPLQPGFRLETLRDDCLLSLYVRALAAAQPAPGGQGTPCPLCSIDDGLVQEWLSKAREVAKSKGWTASSSHATTPAADLPYPNDPTPLTDVESAELSRLLGLVLLPTFTEREREIAYVTARAALRTLVAPPKTGWQPIETAPKDGTVIRGYAPELFDADFNPSSSVEACWQDEEGWKCAVWCPSFDVWNTDVVPLTHWQPLPAPPAQEPR